jgi:hypothetical protein
MNIIQEFGNLSGLKLNKNKTEGIWLGRLKHTKDKYEHITWTNEPSDPEPSSLCSYSLILLGYGSSSN